MNYLAKFMLEKILGVLGLKSEVAELLWTVSMRTLSDIGRKIATDGYLDRAFEAYDIKMRQLIDAYTNGDQPLADTILNDILGTE